MRILLGLESYFPNVSGVVIFTKRLATYLVSHGHEVRIVTTSPTGFYSEEKDPAGFFITRLKGWRNPFRRDLKISYLRNVGEVRRIINEFGPDIIHAQGPDIINHLILREAKKLGIPVIAHHHFSLEFVLGYFRRARFLWPFIAKIVKISVRNFYNRCDLILTPTEFSRRTLLGWGVTREVIAVSNGVELERFNPPDKKDEKRRVAEVAGRYGISLANPIVLYIGRMDQDKSVDVLVRSIPKVLEKIPAFFLFVGEGNDRKWLEGIVSAEKWKDRVKFLGFINHDDPDLPAIYRLSSLAWTASTIETQSITTLEAMASGLPIVAADAGALPELVHENENGFLVEPKDVAGFADAAVEILRSGELRERFSKASVKIASEHAIEKSMERLIEIYKGVIGA